MNGKRWTNGNEDKETEKYQEAGGRGRYLY
jgi:hypothetical protein